MDIRHEATGRGDRARIHIAGLARDLRILHLTDSHITEVDDRDPEAAPYAKRRGPDLFFKHTPNGESTREVFDRTLSDAREMGVDAGVLTGDIIDFPAWAGIEHVDRGMKALGASTLFAPGNHDWHFQHLEWSDAVRQEYYPRLHGLTAGTPACQSMELGDVRLIALDNSTYQVTPEQLTFLRRELAAGQPCLLFMHIPIWIESLAPDVMKTWGAPIMMAGPHGWTAETRERWKVAGNDPSTLEAYELLTRGESENLAGIFCGHLHFEHADAYREGRFQYVSETGFSGGYRIIDLLK
jgi:3',5'-cyclic AMP phosphodiesterase CpdA